MSLQIFLRDFKIATIYFVTDVLIHKIQKFHFKVSFITVQISAAQTWHVVYIGQLLFVPHKQSDGLFYETQNIY